MGNVSLKVYNPKILLNAKGTSFARRESSHVKIAQIIMLFLLFIEYTIRAAKNRDSICNV